jgi:hypothetical protein
VSNFQHFFKRSDDASVSNKDLSENESGVLVEDLHESDESALERYFSNH